jgi:DNA-binding response OmpR family regulator
MKIIAIDDDRTVRLLVSRCLEKDGHQVITAESGEQGELLVTQENPDLILLDVMMPGMSGIELCAKLKNNPATKSVPVFMLTGKTQEQDINEALSSGADNYILKPFNPLQLNQMIQNKMNDL